MELKVTKENVHQVFDVLVPFLEKIEKGYVASFLEDEQAILGMIFDGSEDSFDFISEKLVIVVDSVIDAELNNKERSELEKILQSTIGSELNEAEKEVEEVERFEVTVENLSESYDAVIKVLKEKGDDVALSSFENDYRILTFLFDGSEGREREVTEKLVALTQSAVDELDAEGVKKVKEIVTNTPSQEETKEVEETVTKSMSSRARFGV